MQGAFSLGLPPLAAAGGVALVAFPRNRSVQCWSEPPHAPRVGVIGSRKRFEQRLLCHRRENAHFLCAFSMDGEEKSVGHSSGGIRREIPGPVQQNGMNFQAREEFFAVAKKRALGSIPPSPQKGTPSSAVSYFKYRDGTRASTHGRTKAVCEDVQ